MKLTSDNYLIVAAKAYQSICLSQDDFIRDVRSLNYIRADIVRYLKENNTSNLRAIINRFIIASNNFGPIEAMRLMFFVVRKNSTHICVLKTLFAFLEIFEEGFVVSNSLKIDDKYSIDDVLLKELNDAAK